MERPHPDTTHQVLRGGGLQTQLSSPSPLPMVSAPVREAVAVRVPAMLTGSVDKWKIHPNHPCSMSQHISQPVCIPYRQPGLRRHDLKWVSCWRTQPRRHWMFAIQGSKGVLSSWHWLLSTPWKKETLWIWEPSEETACELDRFNQPLLVGKPILQCNPIFVTLGMS